MERIYMIVINDDKVTYTELTKKGYAYMKKHKGEKDTENYWSSWFETINVDDFINVLNKGFNK